MKSILLKHSKFSGYSKRAVGIFGGDISKISILELFGGEGNGTPLQYSCLENPIDRGAW